MHSSRRPRRRSDEPGRASALEPDRGQGVPHADAHMALPVRDHALRRPARWPRLGRVRGNDGQHARTRRLGHQLRHVPLHVLDRVPGRAAGFHHARAHGRGDQQRTRAANARPALRHPARALLDPLGQAPCLDVVRRPSPHPLHPAVQPRLPSRRDRAGPGGLCIRGHRGDGAHPRLRRHRVLVAVPANAAGDRRGLRCRVRPAPGRVRVRLPLPD